VNMRVILIDDHSLFRLGLESLLARREIDVVASVGSGKEGVQQALALKPDVILLDLRMPHADGLQTLQQLRESDISAPVLMLTTSHEQEDLVRALRSGAQGYLLKDMEPDELVMALEEVAKGETVIARQMTGALARVVQTGAATMPASALSDLTPREREILTHLAEGHSNKIIARALDITVGTVKLHVKSVLRKLQVRSRVEAAIVAVERGFTRR
jgi:two-component system nitrate/nitrite response regulator NarL